MTGAEANPAFVTRTDLEKLTNDFNEQLNENMSILRKEILTEVGTELRKQLAEFHPDVNHPERDDQIRSWPDFHGVGSGITSL